MDPTTDTTTHGTGSWFAGLKRGGVMGKYPSHVRLTDELASSTLTHSTPTQSKWDPHCQLKGGFITLTSSNKKKYQHKLQYQNWMTAWAQGHAHKKGGSLLGIPIPNL